ncbi:MAG: hypothetical protein JSR91_04225 [Proteobacteria bacterium]|nr:hypothetical protein [Pseudomonadota bacterium]
MTSSTNGPRQSALTDEEEVTLRRVAFGESEVKAMRVRDLARLHRLQLIEDGKDGPRLTAAGRAVFEGLPKAVGLQKSGRRDDLLRHMEHLLRGPQR